MRKWWLQWLQQQHGWWLELNLLQYALTKPYWSKVGGGSRVRSENELTRLKRSPRRNPAFKGINSEFWWRGQIILMEKMKWFNWQDCHKDLLWSGRKGGGVRSFDFKFADLSVLQIDITLFVQTLDQVYMCFQAIGRVPPPLGHKVGMGSNIRESTRTHIAGRKHINTDNASFDFCYVLGLQN